jgi:hypothetical protein
MPGMSHVLGLATVLLMGLSALGGGRAVLAALGLREKLGRALAEPVALALGVGLIGWLGFFFGVAGFLSRPALVALTLPGLAGLLLHRAPSSASRGETVDAIAWAMLALLATIAVLDLAQAMAPPADADTLAYHFALPKEFLRQGRILFVPRAVDGGIPLLLQTTYLLALGIAGESALTLWVAALGWAVAWLLYALARPHLGRNWTLAVVLVFVTTPAVVYGEGSGQLELKLALFSLVAMLGVARARGSGEWRLAALAGLAAGCYVGAKYTGLLFAGSCGLVLLAQRRWLLHGAVFGLAAMAVGWQWYVWNYINSGDPIFPLLADWVGARHGFWSAESGAFLRAQWTPEENPVPRSLYWLVAYPFVATLGGPYNWDAGRTGLGPCGLLVLPFALAGAWRFRDRIAASPLAASAAITLVYYLAWFLTASSQRVRHLLPVYPVMLLCLTLAARRFALACRLTAPLVGALVLTVAVQGAGALVFNLNYLRHLASGESREAFLERNVARYAPVPWINAHLGAGDRILVTERQLVYHLEVPSYTASQRYQYLVDLLPGSSSPERFLGELERLGITHLLVVPSLAGFASGERHFLTDELLTYTSALVASGCARIVHSEVMTAPHSRTLQWQTSEVSSDVVQLTPGPSCRISAAPSGGPA